MKETGLKTAWFGILDGLIISGGKSKADVKKSLSAILPEEKMPLVHIFQFRSSN